MFQSCCTHISHMHVCACVTSLSMVLYPLGFKITRMECPQITNQTLFGSMPPVFGHFHSANKFVARFQDGRSQVLDLFVHVFLRPKI